MAIKRKILAVSVDLDIIDYMDNMSKETRISRSVLVNDMLKAQIQVENNKGVALGDAEV